VLGIEHRALFMLGKCSISELHHQSQGTPFCFFCLIIKKKKVTYLLKSLFEG
jgi:hypothetical protein